MFIICAYERIKKERVKILEWKNINLITRDTYISISLDLFIVLFVLIFV